MSMQDFLQKLEMNMRNCKKKTMKKKIELHKYQNYFQNMPSKIVSETIIHETIKKKKALIL